MSLDIYIEYETPGGTVTVWDENITHNLTTMSFEAGLYDAIYHPENLSGFPLAKHILPYLEGGLKSLLADPDYFKRYDSPNGWGTYGNLLAMVEKYITACKQYPHGTIRTR